MEIIVTNIDNRDLSLILKENDKVLEGLNFVQSENAEENTLDLSFCDCFRIEDLLQKVYDAGKEGKTLEIIRKKNF